MLHERKGEQNQVGEQKESLSLSLGAASSAPLFLGLDRRGRNTCEHTHTRKWGGARWVFLLSFARTE